MMFQHLHWYTHILARFQYVHIDEQEEKMTLGISCTVPLEGIHRDENGTITAVTFSLKEKQLTLPVEKVVTEEPVRELTS